MERKVILIGLPNAGKSTFTAALWGVVRSQQIQGALSLAKYDGEDAYLNQLYFEWARGLELTRTQIPTEGAGILELENGEESVGRVVLPDFAGERFDEQWEKRYITQKHAAHLEEVDSVLFFIHSTEINYGQINNEELAGLDVELFPDEALDDPAEDSTPHPTRGSDGSGESVQEGERPEGGEQPFSRKLVSTQTKLVDLLQTSLLVGRSIRKVAVVASAWDLVEPGTFPADWLEKELPLLAQYLTSNSDQFAFRIWGISAQGGVLGEQSTKQEREALLAKAMLRIRVTNGSKVDSDITRPLKWLFGL